ncbi:MAG: glycosyl transferase, partial [Treponema sp.]|nr:glycosyl transferase [Treponema sp.]
NFVALSQYICGLRPDYEGLVVEPRLPAHITTAEMTRKFRGTEYRIHVVNNNNEGEVKIALKDASKGKVTGNVVKANAGVKELELTVTIG